MFSSHFCKLLTAPLMFHRSFVWLLTNLPFTQLGFTETECPSQPTPRASLVLRSRFCDRLLPLLCWLACNKYFCAPSSPSRQQLSGSFPLPVLWNSAASTVNVFIRKCRAGNPWSSILATCCNWSVFALSRLLPKIPSLTVCSAEYLFVGDKTAGVRSISAIHA